MTVGKKLFPDGHLIDVNSNMAMRKNIKYDSTHWLALDEQESFFVFPILIPSIKLLFVYLISENADWTHKNSHEDLDPHTPS